MAGRPAFRIGEHGKITRTKLGNGSWLARCRYRDRDGVTRIVQRVGPPDEHDQYGKLAVDALKEALSVRRLPTGPDAIGANTLVTALLKEHLSRLAEDGRADRTLDTYRSSAAKLQKFLGGVRVGEATPARLDAALRSMRTTHGATTARQSKTILRGALQLAVMTNALTSNPVRDVQTIKSKHRPKGAVALTAEELRALLPKLRASQFCRDYDLVDPITLLIATGLRESELLGLLWTDFYADDATLTVTGKVARPVGKGMQRYDTTKTEAGLRTLPLPRFAVDMLTERRYLPYLGEQTVIFPSTAGTLRDPNNFNTLWRRVRDDLGVPGVTTHSFRKSLATLIDDEGLSARIGADHLGHAHVSMTQDRYMSRGRIHPQVAALLDRTIAISDE
ncbi:site-specific integrase [Mycolicibacterium sp. Dal123E01]|uniref:site-specific integrase n=1 Tax=Mycolicibacterium sp. Dal123E01 TaxID=3457578 RepID=UPI00403E74F6